MAGRGAAGRWVASRLGICDRSHMDKLWLMVGSSALVGGLAGAAAASLLLRREPPATARPEPAAARQELGHGAREDRDLLTRIEAVERRLSVLGAGIAMPTKAPRDPAAPAARGTPAPPEEHPEAEAPLVGDPVFEAAVLDILDRAEEGRDSERDLRRAERQRQQVEHWAQELTQRLELSPAQASQVLAIRTQLTADLRERRRSAEDGKFVPREQRRAIAAELRERAEQALHRVLEPRQRARYNELDDELKIVRPPDSD